MSESKNPECNHNNIVVDKEFVRYEFSEQYGVLQVVKCILCDEHIAYKMDLTESENK